MKRAALLSTVLLFLCDFSARAGQSFGPGHGAAVSFQVENDYRFSDRYYTNALKLNYTDFGDDWRASFLQFKILRLFRNSGDAQNFQTASIGQDMYVGRDISLDNPPLDDRPYAGWLYLSSGAHIASENALDSLTVTVGIIGPQSYAGDTQKAYHDIINEQKPMGWGHQLKNEPGIIIAYNHSQRLLSHNFSDNFRGDIIGALGGNLGNVSTEARAKAFFRIGFNLPHNFEPNRIDASAAQDIEWARKNKARWHLYFYAGVIGRAVLRDITLDGNTFAQSRSVSKNWVVGESNVGISARYKMLELALNWVVRTEDFNAQKDGPHIFWSASAKVFF